MKKQTLILIAIPVLTICFAIAFYAMGWTEPISNPPGGNISLPLNTSAVAQTKAGNLIVNALGVYATGNALLVPNGNVGIGTPSPSQKLDVAGYIKGQTGLCIGSDCRNAWPDSPLSNLNRFVVGHEYPYEDDPYLRDAAYPYPYLTLENAINKYGVNPANPLATNWFAIGYSHWQPYTQYRSALFINEGDNSSLRNLYSRTSSPWTAKNANDEFIWCHYYDNNDVRHARGTYDFCYNCATNSPYQTCKNIITEANKGLVYADSTSNLKGRPVLQIRLRAWWQPEKCTKEDYLPGMELSGWGDPKVVNFKINPYQLPNIAGDICYGANIHSKIEARFVNVTFKQLSPSPIINFYNVGSNFTYMIESFGIAYLTWLP